MGKKKFLERISDALGLYDPDDPNREMDEEEDDEEEEEVVEKPAKRGFPKAVRQAPVPVAKEEPESVPADKEAKGKKPGLLSRMRKSKKENRTIQMKTTTEVRVVVIEPTSFDDSQKVADFLRNDQPVVVNFETTEPAVRKRMTDFISGTIYALNGTVRTIGPNILVCAPRNVDIDAEAEVYNGERGGIPVAEKLNLHKLAFIGGGAMGEAIIKGITGAGLMDPAAIFVGAHRQERADYLHETYGVTGLVDNCEAVKDADMVVLAIKPQMVDSVLRGALVSAVPAKAVILSIMGSVTIEKIAGIFNGHPVIRTMPNTPLAVGAGMTAIAPGTGVSEEAVKTAEQIFGCCGETLRIQEKDIEAVTAVSGCGPGYVYVMIDALADAGVMAGLPRAAAIKLAAQTFAGSGKMVLETGKHPAVLRDMVTSPGGTTIAGIKALENGAVRGALYNAVQAVLDRSEELKGNK